MFFSLVTQLVAVGVAIRSVAAVPALSIPTSGTYRILNIGTGLFLDASESEQTDGTPVIVFTLNEPLTPNQEWTLDVFDSPSATLQSISAFFLAVTDPSTGVQIGTLSNEGASTLLLQSASTGVNICTQPRTCLTSGAASGDQVTIQDLVDGDLDQVWVFEQVGN